MKANKRKARFWKRPRFYITREPLRRIWLDDYEGTDDEKFAAALAEAAKHPSALVSIPRDGITLNEYGYRIPPGVRIMGDTR